MTTLTRPLHVPARRHAATVGTTVLLVAGLLVGSLAWAHQLESGLAATGLSGVVPWGLYTVAVVLLAAICAGALGLAATGLLWPTTGWSGLARPALVVSAAAAATALLAGVVNLARPERALNLVLHPNWGSPLVWCAVALLGSLVLAVVLGVVAHRAAGSLTVRLLAGAALLPAVGLPALTAWVFALQAGRPVWNDALLVPILVASACVAGGAVVMLATQPSGAERDGAADAQGRLAAALAVAVASTLLLAGSGHVTALAGGPPERAAADLLLPGGSWSWLLWTQVAAGLAALAVLSTRRGRRSRTARAFAAVGALVAVVAQHVAIVVVGLAAPNVSLPPGVPVGHPPAGGAAFEQAGVYQPSWTEYGVVVGLVAVFLTIVVPAMARRRGPVAEANRS